MMMLPQLNFSVIGVEILLLLVASIIFLIDKFIANKNYAFFLSLITVIICAILVLFTPFGDFTQAYKTDFYSSTVKLFLIFGTLLVLLISYNYLNSYTFINLGEYYALILFSLMGAFLMLSAMDLVTIYLSIELMSFPVYFLIAINYAYNKPSLEGSLKYFIVGSLSSIFLLLSLGVIYYFTGTFYLKEIFVKLSESPYKKELLLAGMLLLISFSIKLSMVPFHMWAPDAYESAPLPITSFIASLVKFAAMAVLIKIILIAFSPLKVQLGQLLIPIILLSILIGNIMAIKQDNIIRMLAYSSIAHAGYAGLGLISADFVGYSFIIFYMLIYLIMTLGIFSILVVFANSQRELLYIPNMAGLSKTIPFISFLILIFMFSLAGVPPTAGFMAKFYIFLSLVKSHYVWVAVLGIAFSVIGAYPYLRVLKVIYMDEEKLTGINYRYDWSFFIPVGITSILVLLIGVYPKPLVEFVQRTLFLYLSTLYFPH
ncbi:MAG: NADH-quinone oxidoreductase subunit N [Thermodesulfobacteriaceae bacterium]|nr:NADH-quinone oxidoreductase subunit N [Thermodesulfobacteriaceae bacterium]MCX8040906.1 NADH-quinone oxidoreductase subunit N [Thermodesulfobacteriaceae bacterium]MDW8136217.1 NADH-quinone oxidoreductase subunit N [Thermodesulfobacterium sp.]